MLVPSRENKQVDDGYKFSNSYAISPMDSEEEIQAKVNKLIHKWYDAAKENISYGSKEIDLSKLPTSKKMKLLEKTRAFTNSLTSLVVHHQHKWSAAMRQAHIAIDEHTKEETEQLARWIGQNSRHSFSEGADFFHGMYPLFYKLYCPPAAPGLCHLKVKDAFQSIFAIAKPILKNKPNISMLNDNIPKIFEKLPLADLSLFIRLEQHKERVSYELFRRLRSGEIQLHEITNLGNDSERKIKLCIGDYASEIENINLLKNRKVYNPRSPFHHYDISSLDLSFAKLFPNLKNFAAMSFKDVDLDFLESCINCTSVQLDGCNIKNIDFSKLYQLKSLIFHNCLFNKVLIPVLCPNLETLWFSNCGSRQTLRYLQFLPNLRSLTITHLENVPEEELNFFENCANLTHLGLQGCKVQDFAFFRHLQNLEVLDVSFAMNLTDNELRKIVLLCPKLNTIYLKGCNRISREYMGELHNKGLKIMD